MAKKKLAAKTAKKPPGTAVAVHKLTPPVTFIEFLDRAARDKDFDAAKFQVVVAAKERQDERAAEAEFDRRMALAQAEMEPIRADMENTHTKSNYASDVAINKAIRPIYSRHGFALQFGTGDNPPTDHVRVTCRVSCAGHRVMEHIDIPVVTIGPKGNAVMTKTHATTSATTVGRRVLLMMIFNLMVTGKKQGGRAPDLMADDDGNAAGGITDTGLISEAQAHEINIWMNDTKADTAAFLDMLSKLANIEIKKVPDIPSSLYKLAMDKLKLKKTRMAQPQSA